LPGNSKTDQKQRRFSDELPVRAQDPSLRLKNGYGRDDAPGEGDRRNSIGHIGHLFLPIFPFFPALELQCVPRSYFTNSAGFFIEG
jgi:hypothetical protein